MPRISGGSARPALAVSALVTLLSVFLAACGDETGDGDTAGSTSDAPSSTPTDAPASGDPGSGADGACGGGEVETQTVEAAEGVRLSLPADWRVKSAAGGAQVGLYPQDRGAGDGFVLVEETGQSLDEAVEEALAITADSAETTSEQDLELSGFAAARMVTFVYDDSDSTFSVDLVAVTEDGLRVVANMVREVPEEQSLVESCLSTLERVE